MDLRGTVSLDLKEFDAALKQATRKAEGAVKEISGAATTAARGTEKLTVAQKQQAALSTATARAQGELNTLLAGGSREAARLASQYHLLTGAERGRLLALKEQIAAQRQAQAEAARGPAGRPDTTALGLGLTASVTAPLVLLGRSAVMLAANFEQSMDVLQTVTRATGGEIARMSELARDLGADLTLPATSALDASKAMLELSKAGLSVTDTMGAAKGTLQLAAAANVSAGQAAEITSNALNAFGLAGDQATRVADLLAAASIAASGEITDMAQGFKQASAVFAGAGRSAEELTTSLAVMAKRGIQGSDAGTSLRVMLMRLQAPTKEATAVMKALGVTAYDSQGRMRPLRDLVAQFTRTLGGVTQEQRNWALATIFGQDAIRAAQNVLVQGTAAWDENAQAVKRSGAAAELAAAQNAGLKGAIDAFGSALDTAKNEFMAPFLADLTGMAKGAGELVNRFAALPEPLRKLTVGLLAAAAAVGPVLLGMHGLRTALPLVALEARAFWVAATGPVGLAIAAVGAFAYAWSRDVLGIRSATQPVLDWLGTTLKRGFTNMFEATREALWQWQDDWAAAWSRIRRDTKPAVDYLLGQVERLQQRFARVSAPEQGRIGPMVDDLEAQLKAQQEAGNTPRVQAAVEETRRQFSEQLFGGVVGKQAEQKVEGFARAAAGSAKRAAAEVTGVVNRDLEKLRKAQDKPRAKRVQLTEGQRQELAITKDLRGEKARLAMILAGEDKVTQSLADRYSLLTPKRREELAVVLRQVAAAEQQVQMQERWRQEIDRLAAARAKLLGDPLPELRREFPGKSDKELQAIHARRLGNERLREEQDKRRESNDRLRAAEDALREAVQSANVAQHRARAALIYGEHSKEVVALDTLKVQWQNLTEAQQQAVLAITKYNNQARETATHADRLKAGLTAGFTAIGQSVVGNVTGLVEWARATNEARAAAAQYSAELFGTEMALQALEEEFGFVFGSKEQRQWQERQEMIAQFAAGTRSVFEGVFQGLERGFSGFFANVYQGFKRLLVQMAAEYLASQVTQAFLGFLGGQFGIKFPVPKRAGGGDAMAGRAHWVGEEGPELFVPRQSGRIMNQQQLAGAGAGANITVNMSISTPDAQSFQRNRGAILSDLGAEIQRAQRRSG